MWRYEQGTPCPPALAQHTDIFSPPVFVDKQKPASSANSHANVGAHNVFDDVFDDYNDSTTRNIAKLMRDEFKNARLGMPLKPRRKQSQQGPAVGVYEDGRAQPEDRRSDKGGSMLLGGGALQARRPQKTKLETVREDRSTGASFGTRKSTNYDASAVELAGEQQDRHLSRDEGSTSKNVARDSRRRTIWLPSDDTTVMSIHPGNYDQTLRDDTICLPPQRRLSSKTPKPALSKPLIDAARPPVSIPPKRAPLSALAPTQPNVILRDRAKCLNGKENIPPGTAQLDGKSEKSYEKPIAATIPSVSKVVPATRTSLLREQNAASQARLTSLKKRSVPEPKEEPPKTKSQVIKDPRARLSAENSSSLKLREHIAKARARAARPSLERQAPNKLSSPHFQPHISANLSRYPVLADDLVQPELYEDNWLSHQEVALSQLINSVFQQADSTSLLAQDDVSSIRGKLLKLYQQTTIVTLHKRVKASLAYGALSMPKETKEYPRLREDVGLRRQFLDLWVQSYNLDALQAAAEVITGRAMTSRPRDAASIAKSLGSTSGGSSSVQEKELRRFLLTFLVHNEDAVDASSLQQKHSRKSENTEERSLRVGSPEWFWHRSVLHSLMLIHLLDTAKASGNISTCLFQTSSIRKSSTSILHAMTRMILPWIGDITRPLGYLDYSVSHAQLPLAEYVYRITNIATDLRNGVLLTRFVELLLYPPSSSTMKSQQDKTLTLSLPDGETLTTVFTSNPSTHETWPLSQHLKFPCAGRPQKLHNVSVALSALDGLHHSGVTEAAISAIRADDIVDGHREKTLSLLWSLVSRRGMGLLVDWAELKREIHRSTPAENHAFDARLYLDDNLAPGDDDRAPDSHEQASLLKAWVSAICAKECPDVAVTNLTTSFADGRALNVVVAAYAYCLPAATMHKSSTSAIGPGARKRVHPTAAALQTLGCSESFISLFASPGTVSSTIPCRSTTLALLAFLASRLLPLASWHRAARTVQKTWRGVLARRDLRKRAMCKVLAEECKVVVEFKREFEGAAVVLQRAWRVVVRSRKERERVFATELQALCRGWSTRRRANKERKGKAGGGAGERRVMGGW